MRISDWSSDVCSSDLALIEFALVGPPFLLLLAGILEISVMFFASSVIEGATKEAARQIRTGQIQGAADPMTTFRNELCDGLRSEEHTSELQSLMRISYAVFCLKKNTLTPDTTKKPH